MRAQDTGVSDIRDHAITTFESLFYGQYVPQSRRESKATIRQGLAKNQLFDFFFSFSFITGYSK